MDLEHDYRPADMKCVFACAQCGCVSEKHSFKPIPGRCAEICSVCGEERDYMKIAMDESLAANERASAIAKLKKASMIPAALKENCAKELNTLWEETRRLVNPNKVYVDLSKKLYKVKKELLDEAAGIDLN